MTSKYDRSIEDIERARMDEGRFWTQRYPETTPYGTGAVAGSLGSGEAIWQSQPRVFNTPYATPVYGVPPSGVQSQSYVPGVFSGFVPPQTFGFVPGFPTPVHAASAQPIAQPPMSPAFAPIGQNVYWLAPHLGVNPAMNPYAQLPGNPFLANPYPGMSAQTGLVETQVQSAGLEGLTQRSPFIRQASRAFGRPPRGYKRSDELIRDEICKRLALTPEIDATDVEVIVKDGEVALRGTVDDRFEKRLAEDITETTFGVRDVLNEIRIGSTLQEHELSTVTKGKEK